MANAHADDEPPTSTSAATESPSRSGDPRDAAAPRAGDASPDPSDAGAAATARVVVETPFKLGAGPARDAELERWNRGGLGRPSAEQVGDGHPQPRVVVDVESLAGARRRDAVERELRRLHWGHVVGCYARAAWAEPALRGDTRLRLTVHRDGRVTGAKLLATTLENRAVAECIVAAMRRDALGAARGPSTVVARVHVAPGDEPIAPPAEIVVPGRGVADVARLEGAVVAARPRLEACYARALELAPGVWGRVAVRLLLEPATADGPPREAFEVDSSFPEASLRRCVLRELRATPLPPSVGGEARYVVGIRFGEPPTGEPR